MPIYNPYKNGVKFVGNTQDLPISEYFIYDIDEPEKIDKISSLWENTSGKLMSNGYAKDSFRSVFPGMMFYDTRINCKFTKKSICDDPAWNGIHLFLRYQNSNNFFCVSIRNDDTIIIKQKLDGDYMFVGHLIEFYHEVGEEISVNISLVKQNLTLTVDTIFNQFQLPDELGWGTVGLRGDNTEVKFKHFRIW